MTSQTPKETQDTDVEEVVEEVAGHLQHLLTIAEGKEEIEQWNTHAANLINAVTKVLHHQLQKAREEGRLEGWEQHKWAVEHRIGKYWQYLCAVIRLELYDDDTKRKALHEMIVLDKLEATLLHSELDQDKK